MNIAVVILAAGQGTRMRSTHPKVLHSIGGKPMLEHVITATCSAIPDLPVSAMHVVIGHGADQVKSAFQSDIAHWVMQSKQLGTGHAVKEAAPACKGADIVLVLYGDVPLIRPETLNALISASQGKKLALLTVQTEEPYGYGRIIRNADNEIKAIVEEKDATPTQKAIKEINTGIMAIPGNYLEKWLHALKNDNTQGEFYLTDVVELAAAEGVPVTHTHPSGVTEVLGVNNRRQQAQLEREYQRFQCEQLMDAGVTLLDPSRTDIRGQLEAGQDVIIDTNCIFEGTVSLGNNVTIGSGCIIRNTSICDNTQVAAYSLIDDSQIDSHCTIGPFARLRPGTHLKKSAKIGNFVETKKAQIGEGSKVNHLSYVGDAEVGQNVNIGAGTVTCNYDGVNKYKTIIKDNAFVGSNTALVAPVSVGMTATIGAGSTITGNIDNEQLAVARSRQRNIDGWQRPVKK